MTYPIEKAVVFERLTGRVVSSGTTQAPERMATDTLDVLVGELAIPNESYVQDGVIVQLTPRPSDSHDFDWGSKRWVPNLSRAWYLVKTKRSALLADCDWIVTKSSESGQAVPVVWVAYRQALRDITLQTDPAAIIWPTPPQ